MARFYVVVSRSTNPNAPAQEREWVVCVPYNPADRLGSEPVFIDGQTGRYAIYASMTKEQKEEWERPTAATREWLVVEVEDE